MSERITNVEIQEFLTSFERDSKTIILEEGKEKNELEKIAEARGIKIKGSRDLAIFKTIYAFTDKANANGAILPKEELLKVLPQIVGKPININHERRLVVGHYIDYRYKQKDSQINAYGIYYKSNFGEEFEEAKKLLKKKKLSSSFEIWSPKEKRKYKPNGDFEMLQMEIAGGALIYEDAENEPAFKDAKVLTMAKEKVDPELELVYASKHKEEELITSAGETIVKEKVEQTISKVKCSNCSEEFDSGVIDKIKCPKCFAILDKSGNMIYPPQIKDFQMLCPACKTNNWLILSKKEDKAKVRCMGCSKEYELTFKTKENAIAKDFAFLYTSKVSCLQCHTPIYVSGVSTIKKREIKCKRCSLTFSYDITHDRYKNISKIEEVIPKENKIDKTKESSEEGGQKMAKEKKVEKASEKKIEVKKEAKVEPKKEVKAKEEKVEVKKEKKVEKKIEKKVEAKETPKAEKTPKTAEKVEEPKAKEKSEVKEEKAKEKSEVKVKEKKEVKVKAKEAPKAEEPKVEPKIEKKEVKVKATKKETPKEEKPKVEKKIEKKVEAKKVDKTDKYKAGIRKIAKMVKALRKEKASLEKKVKLYADNAKKIIERQAELGEGYKLTDEEILNDDKFGKAKAEKELAKATANLEKGNDISGKKYAHNDKWYKEKQKAIDKLAFKKDK